MRAALEVAFEVFRIAAIFLAFVAFLGTVAWIELLIEMGLRK